MTQHLHVKTMGEARDGFADVVSNAQLGIPTEVTNRGKRAAVVVPPEVWDSYVSYVSAELRGLVADAAEEEGAEPLNDVLQDVVAETTA